MARVLVRCPAPETLSAWIDRAVDADERRAIAAHLDACAPCQGQLDELLAVDRALRDDDLWPAASGCLVEPELLAVLEGAGLPDRQAHVLACAGCAAELSALSDLLDDQARGATFRATGGLAQRLRGMAPAAAATSDLLRPAQGSARQAGARSASAARRDARRSSRRRARVPAPLRRASPFEPAWAFGTLAAAASLLVVAALALRPDAPQGGSTARRLDGPPVEGGAGLKVSDLRGAPGQQAERPREPAERGDEVPEPQAAYPWPQVDPDQGGPAPRAADAPTPARPAPVASEPRPAPATTDGAGTRTRPSEPTPARDADGPGSSAGDPPPARPPETFVDDGGRLQIALERVRGAAVVTRGGEALPLARGAGTFALQPGDRVRPRAGGVLLSLDDGTYDVCVDADADVVVRAATGGPVLGLERGRLLAEVAALPADRRFAVATPDATFVVHGTVFGLEAGEAGSRLEVREGLVEAGNGLGRAMVAAGSGVDVARGDAPGALRAADPARLGWARGLAPQRDVLYQAGFEGKNDMGGFLGEVAPDEAQRGVSLVFGALEGNDYWGMVARAARARLRSFRASPDTWVAFRVRSEQRTQVLVESTNETQNKLFKRELGALEPGRWRTFHVPLMELSTYFDPGKSPVREGDLFVDLAVFAGPPGARFRVLLDDVVVYRKLYR